MTKTDIWAFQKSLSLRLLAWSALSVPAGSFLILTSAHFFGPFWGSFGLQALIWGLVDAAIGGYGLISAGRIGPEERTPAGQFRQAARLGRLLWINSGLDLLYIAAGAALVLSLGRTDPAWSGHGWGIIVQGGFLLIFDWQHALRVPAFPPEKDLRLFWEPEHAAYFLKGGRAAALVVHGFPGTPQEVRPVAEALHREGWTVQGLLLPGFGAQLVSLPERTYEEWLETVVCALRELQREYEPVVLVGFSMGGALSVKAATLVRPDGLVLMAPFIWRSSLPERLLLRGLPFVLPSSIRPFRWRFLANPKTRRIMNALMRQADLEDPETRAALAQMSFPVSIFYEVRKAGMEALANLGKLDLPVLVVQGRLDRTVWPAGTRRMLRLMPRRPEYVEVEAGHDLFEVGRPAWREVEEAVVGFGERVKGG